MKKRKFERIALYKKNKIQDVFDNWWEGGKWCDDNKELFMDPDGTIPQIYSFEKISRFRYLIFKLLNF